MTDNTSKTVAAGTLGSWWSENGNKSLMDTDADRYRRHLLAIFNGPCRCWKMSWWRPCCLRNARRYGWGDPCIKHNSLCQACIAEHALYIKGDHPAMALDQENHRG